jgi:MFS family permease
MSETHLRNHKKENSHPKSPGAISVGRTFTALSDPVYRVLWIGMLLQTGAMMVTMFAQGYFVYELTGSASKLGIASAAMVTGAPFMLIGGVLADRMDKKRLIQLGQLGSMAIVLLVALSISMDLVTWKYLAVASGAQGLIMPFMMPARQSIIPQLVPKDKLMNAVALSSMAMSFTTMVAPAIAGLVISMISIEVLYYLIVIIYGCAIIATHFVPSVTPVSGTTKPKMLQDLKAGFGYIRANGILLLLLLLGFTQVFFMMPVRNMLPVFAEDVFAVGPDGLGIIMSALGFGALVGSLIVASLRQGGNRGIILIVSGCVSAIVVIGFSVLSATFPVFVIGLLVLFSMGLIQAGRMTMQQTLVMEYVETSYRGRVISFNMLAFGLMPLGVLPLGILADALNAPIAVGMMATLFLVIMFLILIFSPKLRHLK